MAMARSSPSRLFLMASPRSQLLTSWWPLEVDHPETQSGVPAASKKDDQNIVPRHSDAAGGRIERRFEPRTVENRELEESAALDVHPPEAAACVSQRLVPS